MYILHTILIDHIQDPLEDLLVPSFHDTDQLAQEFYNVYNFGLASYIEGFPKLVRLPE